MIERRPCTVLQALHAGETAIRLHALLVRAVVSRQGYDRHQAEWLVKTRRHAIAGLALAIVRVPAGQRIASWSTLVEHVLALPLLAVPDDHAAAEHVETWATGIVATHCEPIPTYASPALALGGL